MKKKAVIVVDNYKLEKFKKELTENKFEFEIKPFSKDTSQIHVECLESDYQTIKSICTKVEFHFKRSN